jgi:hypothetical protein
MGLHDFFSTLSLIDFIMAIKIESTWPMPVGLPPSVATFFYASIHKIVHCSSCFTPLKLNLRYEQAVLQQAQGQ